MIFIDQLVMSADWVRPFPAEFVGPLQRHERRLDPVPEDFCGPHLPYAFESLRQGALPALCGVRRLSYREEGDIDFDGNVIDEAEMVSESQSPAWLHGSHETRLQVKSDGHKVLFAGNPGRFGRPDNIWNLDLDGSVDRANEVLQAHGFPPSVFHPGQELLYDQKMSVKRKDLIRMGRADEADERRFAGARVWSIHMTQNFVTGSPTNLQHTLNWLATQSMRRVTSKRRGASTLEFGAVGYCQTQLYDKAAEILAHTKSKDEKAFLQGKLTDEQERRFIEGVIHSVSGIERKKSEAEILALYAKRRAYQYAYENGLLRVEVKCAKDYLVYKGLTYLGAWDMGKVIEIFKERTEILTRLEVEVDELDVQRLPKALRMAAAAWLAGVDLKTIMPESTFFRKAKLLGEYGLDVYKRRDVAVVRPIMKQIEITAATPPDWYKLYAA